ncbi:hypothetical protein M8494_23385 [Serratia ureilytica]
MDEHAQADAQGRQHAGTARQHQTVARDHRKVRPGLMTASKVIVMTAINSVMAYPVEEQRISEMLPTTSPGG